MANLIIPKKRKLNETEEIAVPWVKCDACGKMTTQGLHQKQLRLVRKAQMVKRDGRWIRTPPVMKQIDLYMCTDCVKRGKKWPGSNPR